MSLFWGGRQMSKINVLKQPSAKWFKPSSTYNCYSPQNLLHVRWSHTRAHVTIPLTEPLSQGLFSAPQQVQPLEDSAALSLTLQRGLGRVAKGLFYDSTPHPNHAPPRKNSLKLIEYKCPLSSNSLFWGKKRSPHYYTKYILYSLCLQRIKS